MRYDLTNWDYYVQTPKGNGKVVSTKQSNYSLIWFVTVELDGDHGCYEFRESSVSTIEAIPKKNNLFRGNPEEHKQETNKSTVKDADVIKALECCMLSNTHQQEECDKCPFNEIPQTICQNLLAYHALQIIKRGN